MISDAVHTYLALSVFLIEHDSSHDELLPRATKESDGMRGDVRWMASTVLKVRMLTNDDCESYFHR